MHKTQPKRQPHELQLYGRQDEVQNRIGSNKGQAVQWPQPNVDLPNAKCAIDTLSEEQLSEY